ncbi:NAD-dependent epimerase/dehydratase family protein [Pseudomonadales bacterium]|nr:NAD-dependent epimerase/dehydratase family protein [Pseudomonadales bacterium]
MVAEGVIKGHILVTGGTGYIGGYLSNKLMNAGYRVTTVSRTVGENNSHICADLTNQEVLNVLAKSLSSVDTIIHCAAIAHGEKPTGNHSVADFNTLISNNILKAFDRHKIRWIFISSISVYGDLYSESSIPLTRCPKPTDSYGKGKLRDEELFISNCSHLDILRLMPVYDSLNLQDIRKRVFLPTTNVKILIRPAPLYSICNLAEVLTVVKQCMDNKSGQRIIQVGDSHPVSQADLLSWFPGRSVPVPQFLFRAMVSLLPKRLASLRNLRFMLKKLGLNNVYEVGCLELGPK